MTEKIAPAPLDARFAQVLQSDKQDFVAYNDNADALIAQHGAATIDASTFPGWPRELASVDAVIETYVASGSTATALSDNEPFVSAWHPLVTWMDQVVRTSLRAHDVELASDAYVTASLTPTSELEGTAHMDDDTFVPTESVGAVAIIAQLVGPRIATQQISPGPLRPMSQITFQDHQLADFADDRYDHCVSAADQLVIFPQFGQLHAGPAARHVAHLSPHRQLLVYRSAVTRRPATPR